MKNLPLILRFLAFPLGFLVELGAILLCHVFLLFKDWNRAESVHWFAVHHLPNPEWYFEILKKRK